MSREETRELLRRASEGEDAAAADLLPVVYDELRALAARFFRDERTEHTLEPTALVHEAWVRLAQGDGVEPRSRGQFYVIAAKAMRNVLVDHARARGRLKRGGEWRRVTISGLGADGGPAASDLDVEALEQALERLAAMDERKARLVELRFFAGLDEREAADVLGMARSTASEQWRVARAWLHRELAAARDGTEGDGR